MKENLRRKSNVLITTTCLFILLSLFLAAGSRAESPWSELPWYKKSGLPPSTPDDKSPWVDLTKIMKKAPPYVIGYASPGLTNPWQQEACAEILWTIDQNKDKVKKFYWTNGNESIPKQIADVEDLMTKGIDVLIIATVNSEALNRTLRKVVSAGIPVLIHERSVSDPEAYTVWLSVDNYSQGEVQFRFIAEQLNGKGDIVILHGLPGSGAAVDQSRGYADVNKQYPGIKVLATEYTNYSRQLGKSKMENLLQAYPKIDGVLCESGLQGIGVFEAVKEAGRLGEIKAWAGDDQIGWLKIVHEYKLKSAIAPVPSWGIVDAVYVAFDLLQGKPTRKVMVIPSKNIDFTRLPEMGVLNLPDDFFMSPVPADVLLEYMKK
jgi:ribose transport system substrate-binding protein